MKWRKVSSPSTFVKAVHCPRCNNDVEYFLAWDSTGGFGLFPPLMVETGKIYAYKCPICPNFDLISNEVAKAIIKG